MTQPAQRTRREKITLALKQQLWLVLALILVSWLMDVLWVHSNQIMVKSIALGALLNWFTQLVFAFFVFRHIGYRHRRHIVGQMYRGQMLKWLLTGIGFALIFITIKPLAPLVVFIGFIVMQVSHNLMLCRIT